MDACEKPIFVFDCNDQRTFFVSASGGNDQLVERGSVITLSASDTIAPVLCAGKVFKFNDIPTNDNPFVAYVVSNGNDNTAIIGSIDFPYATMQKAYLDGARFFELGVGTFAGLSALSGGDVISVRGRGGSTNQTVVEQMKKNASVASLTIEDAGYQSIFFENIGETTPLSSSSNPIIVLNNVVADYVWGKGPTGTSGADVEMTNCKINYFYDQGGNGNASTLSAGHGGDVIAKGCVIGLFNNSGGNSNFGNGGDSGEINLFETEITGSFSSNGGNGSGFGGVAKSVIIERSRIGTVLNHNGGLSVDTGNINHDVVIRSSSLAGLNNNGSTSDSIGADGGDIIVEQSIVQYIDCIGGGGSFVGRGGSLTANNSHIPTTINVSSGEYETHTMGDGGNITLFNTHVGGDIMLRGGLSGSGGTLSAYNCFLKGVVDMSAMDDGVFFPIHTSSVSSINTTTYVEFPEVGQIMIFEDFMGTSTSTGLIGELGFGVGGSATFTRRGSEVNHPGIFRMERTATGTGYLHLTYLTGQGITAYTGTSLETVIRLNSLSGNSIDFGLAGVGTLTTSGRKGWNYDPAISPNWRLIHVNSSGVVTATDSGIPAVAGWQILKLSFQGATTVGKVTTTAGHSVVSNSGSATTSTSDHAINYSITVTLGTQSMDIDCLRITSPTILDRRI